MAKRKNYRNDFILTMPSRADKLMREMISNVNFHLTGVEDFDAAMGAIVKSLMRMYERGVCDALDSCDGNPLRDI